MVGISNSQAHPHAWLDLRTTFLFNEEGKAEGLRVHWLFDEFYTAFVLADLDTDGDGVPEPERLKELADINLGNLAPFDYFTSVTRNGEYLPVTLEDDYSSSMEGSKIALNFTHTFEEPVDPLADLLGYAVYDPTYFVEILHIKGDPIAMTGEAPPGCQAHITDPDPGEDLINFAASLSQFESGGDELGILFAEQVSLDCK